MTSPFNTVVTTLLPDVESAHRKIDAQTHHNVCALSLKIARKAFVVTKDIKNESERLQLRITFRPIRILV